MGIKFIMNHKFNSRYMSCVMCVLFSLLLSGCRLGGEPVGIVNNGALPEVASVGDASNGGVNMDDADMDGTDISTTHISEADIDGEDMRDAEISGADIGGSDMGGDTAGAVGLVAEYRKISAEQAKEMMGGGQEYILLDVRSREEWEQSRIDGSLLIPDTLIRERASDELPDKDALILIYCRSGRRSAAAAEVLVSLGYTNVYDFGGIISWPYETTSGK